MVAAIILFGRLRTYYKGTNYLITLNMFFYKNIQCAARIEFYIVTFMDSIIKCNCMIVYGSKTTAAGLQLV